MTQPNRANHLFFCLAILLVGLNNSAHAQCPGILEPGFAFLTSSRGCAPYTVQLQTAYLSAGPGTQYDVDWGDGSLQTYTQVGVGSTGVIMTHTYLLASVNCGYDVRIDASNACNPIGSVVPITTQVIVWTNDVVAIGPTVYRVCAGFAANVIFTDNSTWNCFPRATRENNAPRWIQWIYGTGALPLQIPGIQVNSVTPGAYPYLNPIPGPNPFYPIVAPGSASLPINVPVTTLADIGKEFEITLKNWNQCNPYDNNLVDGNPFNPVLAGGDNLPQVTTAKIVIVDAPAPSYVTRLGNSGGPLQTAFCISDVIYFDNNTPAIGGASFSYNWKFFDNNTGVGAPLGTKTNRNPTFSYTTSGQKLIRLTVTDQNAVGACTAIYDDLVNITPSLVAKIQALDFTNNPITPYFCQSAASPFSSFQVRFSDVSIGIASPTTEWKWEFYNENNVLVQQAPLGGGFSAVALGPFDQLYSNKGIYRAVLVIRDNVTLCQTTDQMQVRIYEKPVPVFTTSRVCRGSLNVFTESSTLNAIKGESIALREWDFNYNGVTFNKDPAFDNQTSFSRSLGVASTYQVALRVTTNQNACSSILTVPVIIDALPTANFLPGVTSGCSILTVTFKNNSVLGQPDVIDRFVWEVDEKGGLGFLPVATQHPTDPGFTNQFVRSFTNMNITNKLFDVRLRVVTANNCETISAPTTITVFPGTRSGFLATNYSPFNDNCSPVSVSFSVDPQTQSLAPASYRWRVSDLTGVISDVTTGTTPAYTHNFINPSSSIKDFTIKLTTTLTTGCFGDSVRNIRVSPLPISAFKIDTLAYDCQRMRLRFTAQQKGLTYHWAISDNGIPVLNSSGPTDVIEYESVASSTTKTLIASLDTKNLANCVSNITTMSVTVPPKLVIGTSFTATPSTQIFPSATVFFNNTTNTGPWTYQWDFGDGLASNNISPVQHTYSTPGTYTIKLTVKYNGCIEMQTKTITIKPTAPIVDFSYGPPSGCQPLTVKFTNLSKFADLDSYVWNFGDGQASSKAVDPSYTYYEPGKYKVSLSASNITGQMTEIKQSIIEVFAKPSAQFDIKPKIIYIPDGILYTKNNSFGASRFLWDFGDGGTSEEFEPQYAYKQEGIFDITLIAISTNNCSDTTTVKNATASQNGGQLLVPNAFSPNVSGGGSTGGQGGQGDGKNDVFLPIMRGVTQFEMLVFNRWGELLFQTADPHVGWDGYFNGKLCMQDVYMFKVTAQYENGERVVRTGDINLIR